MEVVRLGSLSKAAFDASLENMDKLVRLIKDVPTDIPTAESSAPELDEITPDEHDLPYENVSSIKPLNTTHNGSRCCTTGRKLPGCTTSKPRSTE
ncbi:hypothetical protein ACP70R_012332 [Stipagrostis hirtigluma subsp. patula]